MMEVAHYRTLPNSVVRRITQQGPPNKDGTHHEAGNELLQHRVCCGGL